MFIAKCQECQLVKVEHQHPSRLLQLLTILEWKWEVITMDFIISLPKSKKQNDSIFVVIDKLSKVAHFILVKSTYKVDETRLLWSKERLYFPEGGDIKSNILTKFLQKPCLGNLGYQKMISAVKKQFF